MYYGERFNSISALIGAVAALAGMVLLVVLASIQGDTLKIVSFSIYGVSLFALHLISVLYHSFRGRAKVVFRILDHNAIYLLIAGTYTPYMLVDTRLQYTFRQFTAYGEATNLFNTKYTDIGSIYQPGRCINAGVIFRISDFK